MSQHCGLIASAVPCRCSRRISHAVATGRVRPDTLLFAGKGPAPRPSVDGVAPYVHEMDELHRVAAIYRTHPRHVPPERILGEIERTFIGGRRIVRGSRGA